MRDLPDGSVDMVLCDLPYGTTACKWDAVLPFDELWAEYWRVAKKDAAIILTAAHPFTAALAASQIRNFKYCWYWIKPQTTGFMNANKMPLKNVEEALVFYRAQPVYDPQGVTRVDRLNTRKRDKETTIYADMGLKDGEYTQTLTNYPWQTLEFRREKGFHPTQKPVALFEYLIRTYTDEDMVVLDNTAGSGTTAVAAENAGRRWICIERDEDYAAKAMERIRNHVDGEDSTVVPLMMPAKLTIEQRFALLWTAAAA